MQLLYDGPMVTGIARPAECNRTSLDYTHMESGIRSNRTTYTITLTDI
ncbi:MAG: hypothetical protein ACM31E_06810 [Fibrobacterota bacterium]